MVPEPLRGQSFVIVEAAFIGDEADGAACCSRSASSGPAMDTFATIPVEELRHLHMDPPTPVPGAGDGMSLVDVTPETIDALVDGRRPGLGLAPPASSSASSAARSPSDVARATAPSARSTPASRCSASAWRSRPR